MCGNVMEATLKACGTIIFRHGSLGLHSFSQLQLDFGETTMTTIILQPVELYNQPTDVREKAV